MNNTCSCCEQPLPAEKPFPNGTLLRVRPDVDTAEHTGHKPNFATGFAAMRLAIDVEDLRGVIRVFERGKWGQQITIGFTPDSDGNYTRIGFPSEYEKI